MLCYAVLCCAAITVRSIRDFMWLLRSILAYCIHHHTSAYCFKSFFSMSEESTTFHFHHDFVTCHILSHIVHDLMFQCAGPDACSIIKLRNFSTSMAISSQNLCGASLVCRIGTEIRKIRQTSTAEATEATEATYKKDTPTAAVPLCWDLHEVQVAVFELLAPPKSPKHHKVQRSSESSERFLGPEAVLLKGPKQQEIQ